MQLSLRKTNNLIKKWAKDLNRHLSKEDITDSRQTHEKMLNSTHYREMQIKTTMRYHLTPVRMAIIKKSTIIAAEDIEKREPSCTVGGNEQ